MYNILKYIKYQFHIIFNLINAPTSKKLMCHDNKKNKTQSILYP